MLAGLEQWLRRRLRSAIWKQWKRGDGAVCRVTQTGCGQRLLPRKRRAALMVRGGWRTRPALTIALPNAYFDSLGIPRLTVNPIAQPAEPPDADPHVRWCDRGARVTAPPMPISEARWQSSHAAACKAVYAGSIPTLASTSAFPSTAHGDRARSRATAHRGIPGNSNAPGRSSISPGPTSRGRPPLTSSPSTRCAARRRWR